MSTYTIDEALTQLAALMEAARRGERVIIRDAENRAVTLEPITAEDSDVITLPSGLQVPVTRRTGPRQLGTAQGQVWMSDDFDAPLDDFAEYLP